MSSAYFPEKSRPVIPSRAMSMSTGCSSNSCKSRRYTEI
jgi:hypothetical protein